MKVFSRRRLASLLMPALAGLSFLIHAGNTAAAPLSDLVPEKYKHTPIVIGTTATMPPIESADPNTGEVLGVEPDLSRAIAAQLGVEIQIRNVAFDGLLAGMQAGRFDIAMAGLADTVQRQAAMDFVDWYASGIQLIVQKGNPRKITTLDSLCGLTLGGTRGATEFKLMETVAQGCAKQTPTVASENSPAGLLMLKTGRIDVFASNFPSGARYVANNPEAELIPGQFKVSNRSAAFAKSNAKLRDAWQAGLKAIIQNGEYDKIMARWGTRDIAYKQATVNSATAN
ncbi:transporter substrate-binding domain-containing protein [Achromobacter aloeverae]